MPRLTELNEVLFSVEEHPVFVSLMVGNEERRLPVPEKKAIVSAETRRVLGIVGRNYRLVSNREALDMAQACCRSVFPETKPGEWAVKATDAPSTAGYCHIDLVHNTTALDFSVVPADQRPEVYGPFIRVTNSYNGLRALAFDIGFYRKVCRNGLIVPSSIIRFKFTHQRRDIGESIHFEIAQERLTKFKTAFGESLAGLRACAVPRQQFDEILRGVLQLQPPKPTLPDTSGADDWLDVTAQLSKLGDRYAQELGENAYAVFNAVTDFASHPPDNRCVRRDSHSLQRLAGSWLTSFNAACRTPGFSILGHLDTLAAERAKTRPGLN